MPKLHGIESVSGRRLFSQHVSRLADYPEHVDLASPRFVLFLCVDGRGLEDTSVIQFGLQAVSQGAVYFCVWGVDCERVHDLLDVACAQALPYGTDETVIMTTFHNGERLAEALWFAIHTAWPASAYEDDCRAVFAVTVTKPEWNQEVVGWLASLPRLTEEATKN